MFSSTSACSTLPYQPLPYTGCKRSVIIVTDDYLCYKETKSPYNFFILILNELFKFTADEWQH